MWSEIGSWIGIGVGIGMMESVLRACSNMFGVVEGCEAKMKKGFGVAARLGLGLGLEGQHMYTLLSGVFL